MLIRSGVRFSLNKKRHTHMKWGKAKMILETRTEIGGICMSL